MMHIIAVFLTALGMLFAPLVPRGDDHHVLHVGAVSSVENIGKEITR